MSRPRGSVTIQLNSLGASSYGEPSCLLAIGDLFSRAYDMGNDCPMDFDFWREDLPKALSVIFQHIAWSSYEMYQLEGGEFLDDMMSAEDCEWLPVIYQMVNLLVALRDNTDDEETKGRILKFIERLA